MLFTKAFAALAIATSVAAAPLANSKPFKFGVTVGGRTLYLTDSEEATENIANGITCTLTEISAGSSKIACGKNQGSFKYANDLHQGEAMKPVPSTSSNHGWAIGSDNVITWKPLNTKLAFSTQGGKKIYAEPCSVNHHGDAIFFKPGVAKAYFE